MFAGAGNILAMRETLRNNRNLLRKHGLFKPLTESYGSPHNAHYKYSESLKFKEATPEQMELLRANLAEIKKVQRLRLMLYVIFSFIMIFTFLGVMNRNLLTPKYSPEERIKIREERINWINKTARMHLSIDSAIFYRDWHQAKKASEASVKFDPNHRISRQKLAFSLKMLCIEESTFCKEADLEIANLVDGKSIVYAKQLNETTDSNTIELLVQEIINKDIYEGKEWPIW